MARIYIVGSWQYRFWAAINTARQVMGDIFSFGAVSEALEVQTDGWKEANRLSEVLIQIADCETAGANGTVKRMAKMARDALGGMKYD